MAAKHDRDQPQTPGTRLDSPRSRRLAGEMNRQAAREQADRVEDRHLEHVARSRSGQALPEIEEIGHDEDREDRRLGDDEDSHADHAAVGQRPQAGAAAMRAVRSLRRWLSSLAPSLVAAVRIFRMLQIPQRPPARDHRNRREVVGRRRRARRPFERPGVPRIVAGPGCPSSRRRPGSHTNTRIADGLERTRRSRRCRFSVSHPRPGS